MRKSLLERTTRKNLNVQVVPPETIEKEREKTPEIIYVPTFRELGERIQQLSDRVFKLEELMLEELSVESKYPVIDLTGDSNASDDSDSDSDSYEFFRQMKKQKK